MPQLVRADGACSPSGRTTLSPSVGEGVVAGNTEAGRLFVGRPRVRPAVAIRLVQLLFLRQDVQDAQRLLDARRLAVGSLCIRQIAIELCQLRPNVGLSRGGSPGGTGGAGRPRLALTRRAVL